MEAMLFRESRRRYHLTQTSKDLKHHVVLGGVGLLFTMAVAQWGVAVFQTYYPVSDVIINYAAPESSVPREHIADIAGSLWIDDTKPNVTDTFVKSGRQRVDLPNLNNTAKNVLRELSGVWTDGHTVLRIDAKHFKGSLTNQKSRIWKDIVVRDISGSFTVLDIGSNRLVIVRRPSSLSVGGASLYSVLELSRRDE